MSQNRLTNRGANANQPAKLPGLQGMRLADPQAQRAFEAIREWLEVRLGARGDAFERAVTQRDLEQRVKPLEQFVAKLGAFDGTAATLRADELEALPTQVRNGAFVTVKPDKLYVGIGGRWREIALVPL